MIIYKQNLEDNNKNHYAVMGILYPFLGINNGII